MTKARQRERKKRRVTIKTDGDHGIELSPEVIALRDQFLAGRNPNDMTEAERQDLTLKVVEAMGLSVVDED